MVAFGVFGPRLSQAILPVPSCIWEIGVPYPDNCSANISGVDGLGYGMFNTTNLVPSMCMCDDRIVSTEENPDEPPLPGCWYADPNPGGLDFCWECAWWICPKNKISPKPKSSAGHQQRECRVARGEVGVYGGRGWLRDRTCCGPDGRIACNAGFEAREIGVCWSYHVKNVWFDIKRFECHEIITMTTTTTTTTETPPSTLSVTSAALSMVLGAACCVSCVWYAYRARKRALANRVPPVAPRVGRALIQQAQAEKLKLGVTAPTLPPGGLVVGRQQPEGARARMAQSQGGGPRAAGAAQAGGVAYVERFSRATGEVYYYCPQTGQSAPALPDGSYLVPDASPSAARKHVVWAQ